MKILIPATREPDYTGGSVVPLGPADDAYWQFWSLVWARRESVIVVEHDITPTGAAIAEMVTCSSGWCAQPYPYFVGTYHGLGCVKFTASFMAATPGLWDVVAGMSDPGHSRKHWCRLDGWAQNVLQQQGHQMCRHQTVVAHSNTGRPSHGCA